jgi:hypothetical protein
MTAHHSPGTSYMGIFGGIIFLRSTNARSCPAPAGLGPLGLSNFGTDQTRKNGFGHGKHMNRQSGTFTVLTGEVYQGRMPGMSAREVPPSKYCSSYMHKVRLSIVIPSRARKHAAWRFFPPPLPAPAPNQEGSSGDGQYKYYKPRDVHHRDVHDRRRHWPIAEPASISCGLSALDTLMQVSASIAPHGPMRPNAAPCGSSFGLCVQPSSSVLR